MLIIDEMMPEIKKLVLSAKLQQLASLRPKISNATRRSCCYKMIVRYTHIRDFLPAMKSDDIDALSVSSLVNRKVDDFIEQIQSLETVTKMLQDNSSTMNYVCALFDAVMDKFPFKSNRLITSAPIIHCPQFESVIVKLLKDINIIC